MEASCRVADRKERSRNSWLQAFWVLSRERVFGEQINGPGRWPGNGSFVLSELQLDATLLPITASIRVSEVEICWLSASNKTYGVDYRSILTPDTWAPLFSNILGNGATICVDDKVVAGQPQRLYRVVVLP